MIFSTSLASLVTNTGFLSMFAYAGNPVSLTIYGGTKPTAAQILASWSTYNSASADYLIHYQNSYWQATGASTLLQINPTNKPNAAAAHSGVATWCIIWDTSHPAYNMSGTTPPSTSFCVGDCSGPTGPGIIRFEDTTCTASAFKAVLDSSITLVMT